MTVKGRSLLAGVVSLIAATGIVAAAVVVLPGTASAAPRRNCLLSVASHPRRALDIRGESVFFRNFLLGKDMKFGFTMGGERSIIDNFDNILSSGESCLLSTASPRVSGFLSVCVPIPGGEQIPPQTGHCEGVRYSIENPAFGTPKVEVLPPATTLRCSVARWTRASRASFGPRSTGCSCCSRFTATPTPLTTRTGFSPSRRDSSVANVLGAAMSRCAIPGRT
jgi:hypothetical protein